MSPENTAQSLVNMTVIIFVTIPTVQGSYRSWKTWKVMEFVISFSRPGNAWNLSEGHGKSWKSNMLGRQMF